MFVENPVDVQAPTVAIDSLPQGATLFWNNAMKMKGPSSGQIIDLATGSIDVVAGGNACVPIPYKAVKVVPPV